MFAGRDRFDPLLTHISAGGTCNNIQLAVAQHLIMTGYIGTSCSARYDTPEKSRHILVAQVTAVSKTFAATGTRLDPNRLLGDYVEARLHLLAFPLHKVSGLGGLEARVWERSVFRRRSATAPNLRGCLLNDGPSSLPPTLGLVFLASFRDGSLVRA